MDLQSNKLPIKKRYEKNIARFSIILESSATK